MTTTTNTPGYAWRALHSWIVDAILHQPDDDTKAELVDRIGGLDFASVFDAFRRCQHAYRMGTPVPAGALMTTAHIVDGVLYYRVVVRGDDPEWHGLVHPPASAIGMDYPEMYEAEDAWNAMRALLDEPAPDDLSGLTDPPSDDSEA